MNYSDLLFAAYNCLHAVQDLCTALAALCLVGGSLWAPLKSASNVFGVVGLDVGKLWSLLGGILNPAGNAAKKGFIHMKLMLGVLALSLCGVVACSFLKAAAPTALTFAECVATDAIQGKSLSDIATDCGGDLLAVVAQITVSTDPAVVASPAGGQVSALKAAFIADQLRRGQ
jgi:hypothetical protein